MFLFVVGHNGWFRVAANRFQHSTETVQQRFRIHNFRNILVKTDENARELPHDLRVNRKYYP